MDKPDKTRGHTDSVERDELDTFTQLVRRWTPDEAERQLLKLGLGHEQVTRIRAAYNAEARRVRELRDPPGLIRGDNSDIAWYLGPADDDLFWPAAKQLIKAQGWTDEDVENVRTTTPTRGRLPSLPRLTLAVTAVPPPWPRGLATG